MNHRVFVYGSLRSGQRNNRLLRAGQLIGPAIVRGVLYDLGAFPGLRLEPKAGDGVVSGEVWSIDDATLGELDRLEGVAQDFYERLRVRARVGNGRLVEAWAYQINERHAAGHSPVEGGDWVGYLAVRGPATRRR